MNIQFAVVVGAGVSGRAAVKLLHANGIKVRLLEQHPENISDSFKNWALQAGIEVIGGEHHPEYFIGADTVIPSPGAAQSAILPLLPHTGIRIMAETELAWHSLHGEKVISVTGTSGKTTTTALISAMIAAQGLSVFTGGNIGTPLSEYILSRDAGGPVADVVVLELSSFQLQTCSDFRPDVGVLLNISENHLDYHADMQEYTAAKMNMFARQTPADTAVIATKLMPLARQFHIPGRVVEFIPEQSRFTEMKLFGAHNRANAEAAFLAAREVGVTEENAVKAAAEFAPIANRLERVDEKHGILFVNDSKATTVEALTVALNAFNRPVCLLAGGKFKGGDLAGLIPLLKQKVRHVALFGASRTYFENAWAHVVPTTWDNTMEQAVIRLAGANGIAHCGDVVLLAPATSSFDQYLNYVQRGNDFKRIVKDLI